MLIKKYLLKSENDNEGEFEVTRKRTTTTSTKTVDIVDDNGNKISARQPTKTIDITQDTEEVIISAISLPSRMAATVEIVETQDVSMSTPILAEDASVGKVPEATGRPQPIRLDQLTRQEGGKPNNINLTKVLHQDESKPITIPKNETIIKAD